VPCECGSQWNCVGNHTTWSVLLLGNLGFNSWQHVWSYASTPSYNSIACLRVRMGSCTSLPSTHILWDLRFSQWFYWSFQSPGLWSFVVWWVVPDVVTYHNAFIFRVRPGKWRHCSPSKCWELLANLHGVTSQKTGIFWRFFPCILCSFAHIIGFCVTLLRTQT
jgi:hypothetical protein